MIRKNNNHKQQTNSWHREEEPHSNNETPGRQTKQSSQLFLPHQDDCKTRLPFIYIRYSCNICLIIDAFVAFNLHSVIFYLHCNNAFHRLRLGLHDCCTRNNYHRTYFNRKQMKIIHIYK